MRKVLTIYLKKGDFGMRGEFVVQSHRALSESTEFDSYTAEQLTEELCEKLARAMTDAETKHFK